MTITVDGKPATTEQLAAFADQAGLATAAQARGGPLTNGEWVKYGSTGRLRLKGSGTITLDTMDFDGTIALAVVPYTAPDDDNEFPDIDYDTYKIRATVPDTVTAELVF